MTGPVHAIQWTETAARLLESIEDRRVRRVIYDRAGKLATSPEQQGKPLVGELAGFRSVRAVGQTYRIIYRVEQHAVIVHVVAVGRRTRGDTRDIYTLAQKLLRQGLLPTRARRRTSPGVPTPTRPRPSGGGTTKR